VRESERGYRAQHAHGCTGGFSASVKVCLQAACVRLCFSLYKEDFMEDWNGVLKSGAQERVRHSLSNQRGVGCLSIEKHTEGCDGIDGSTGGDEFYRKGQFK